MILAHGERERAIEQLAHAEEDLEVLPAQEVEPVRGTEPVELFDGESEAALPDGHADEVPLCGTHSSKVEVEEQRSPGGEDHVEGVTVHQPDAERRAQACEGRARLVASGTEERYVVAAGRDVGGVERDAFLDPADGIPERDEVRGQRQLMEPTEGVREPRPVEIAADMVDQGPEGDRPVAGGDRACSDRIGRSQDRQSRSREVTGDSEFRVQALG